MPPHDRRGGTFRDEHGEIRADYSLAETAHVGDLRDTHRRTDLQEHVSDRDGSSEALDNLGCGSRRPALATGHEPGELVAAESRRHDEPVDTGEPPGHRHQHSVADGVPEQIVHRLEAIEIEDEKRTVEYAVPPCQASDGSVEAVPVEQAGQTIMSRRPPRLPLGQTQPRNLRTQQTNLPAQLSVFGNRTEPVSGRR
nr:hypothetical protein [Micromonospora sp. NBC_01813]